MVICLELGADLHMAQLIPMPLIVSCFSEIQIGFTFLVPAHPGSPGKRAVKRVSVCLYTKNYFKLGEFCIKPMTRVRMGFTCDPLTVLISPVGGELCLLWVNPPPQPPDKSSTGLCVRLSRRSIAAATCN